MKLKALLYALGAYQLWAVNDAFVKLGSAGLPAWQANTIYTGVGTFMLLCVALARRDLSLLRIHNWRAGAVLYAAFVACSLLYFFGIGQLALVDYLTIFYTAPLFTALLAPFFMKEKTDRHVWAALIIGGIGILIAVRWGIAHDDKASTWFGVIATIIMAALFAVRQMATRIVSKTDQFIAIMFYGYGLTFIASLAMCFITDASWDITWEDHTPLWFTPAIALLGNMLNIRALRLTHNTTLMMACMYTQLLTGMALGWLIWGHVLHPATALGAALVIVAGFIIAHGEHRRTHPEELPTK